MSTKIDQKAYLQKYLSGPSDKKKKKKKNIKGKGLKIIDDDIDLSKLRALENDEFDIIGEHGEDAPIIAGIIDERPEEVKKMESFKTNSKWRVISQDDGFNSKIQIEEIKKDIKEVEKENELVFGKMYSDSEDEKKNDSDLSPPRKQSKVKDTNHSVSKKPQNNSDSDFSPPRRKDASKKPQNNSDGDFSPPRRKDASKTKKTVSKNYDSDLSPPRKHEPPKSNQRVRKPSRWGEAFDSEKKSRNRSESPQSPKRYKKHRSSESPYRKEKDRHKKKSPDSDLSPKRKDKKRKSPDSDLSPVRKTQKYRNKNYDSDMSPPRRSRIDTSKKRNRTPDSDPSPPRKRKSPKYEDINRKTEKYDKRRQKSDSESSQDRHKRQRTQNVTERKKSPRNKRKHNSDSDLSPPRKERKDYEKERRDYEKERKGYKRRSDSPPPSHKRTKTLDGKMAGLQDAVQLRQENDAYRRREEEAFSKMTDDVSGRNAKAVSRKSKRDTSEDRQKQKEKEERQKILDEKYKKWSKGVKQTEAQEARVQEFMHEASKPLARYKNDNDLDDRLKAVERADDPMLEYIREKKRERGELGPEKPTYKGNFPPNRFNIRPGYRWDGVDRSNGYEKKYFEQQSKKKAMQEEAYKWSTEDL